MTPVVIAVDIGGTNTRTALVDDKGHILSRLSIPTNPQQGMATGLERLSNAINQLLEGNPPQTAQAIGVATPGLTDPWRGIAFSLANLPGWHEVPLKEFLERAFGLPTFVGNDANLAALGEYRFGAGRGANNMIYLTISTGIGGGIICDGKLLVGSQGFAGEVGHCTIDVNGPRCNCGNLGCLEVMASGTAIAHAAQTALSSGQTSLILQLAAGDLYEITAETVARAAALGDELAIGLIDRAGVYIGFGLVNLIHLFNPELFVIGGGVSKIGEPLFAAIRRTVATRALAMMRQNVRIVQAALGDDAGLLGAAAQALQSCGDRASSGKRSANRRNSAG